MQEYKFALVGTTYYRFANLMEHYTQSNHLPLRCERRMLDRAQVLEMMPPHDIVPEISFEVVTLSEDRIAVVARCHREKARDIFENLIAEIEKYWPDLRREGRGRRGDEETEGRGMNLGTAARVAEARLLIEDGKVATKTIACQMVGVDLKTFNRWYDAPEVLQALEQMRAEGDDL